MKNANEILKYIRSIKNYRNLINLIKAAIIVLSENLFVNLKENKYNENDDRKAQPWKRTILVGLHMLSKGIYMLD